MIAKGEVFNRCVMILCAILGVWPYTAIMEKWKRCGYLPAVKYPSRCLCPSSKPSVNVSDVNDCDETVWNAWQYLSCVSCVCAFSFWDMPLSPSGYAGSWFVLGFVSLFCVGLCFCMRCSVFCVHCSFVCLCSGAWWCHLWWVPGLWLVIVIGVCLDLCLILSLQIRYHLVWSLSVCLVFCCIFSSFSFHVGRVK